MVHQPYDSAAKELFETDPDGWAPVLGLTASPGQVRVVNADLSTVTAAADKVLRIEADPAWLLHVEFQSGWDDTLPRRLRMYNSMLAVRHKLEVASTVILLSRAAQPGVTGTLRNDVPYGPSWEFRYTVVKVWELSPEPLLTGPLVTLPLAMIADVTRPQVPELLARADRRIRIEASAERGNLLMTTIAFLLQLRYDSMTVEELIKSVPNIREFAGFRVFLKEDEARGELKGRRASILAVGRKKFGDPTAEQESALNAMADLTRLEAILGRIFDANSWDELLRAD